MAEIIWTPDAIKNFLNSNVTNEVTSKMILDLIAENKERSLEMQQLYNRYKGKDLPVEGKTAKKNRPNNKLKHDYRGEIIDQKVGYSFGNPITYKFDATEMEEAKAKKAQDFLEHFQNVNSLADSDTQCAKYFSVCGTTSRLIYFDQTPEKNVKVLNLRPWEVVTIRDAVLDEVVYAMRYWQMEEVVDDKNRKFYQVEWYDADYVYYYVENAAGKFVPPEGSPPKEAHGFRKVPVIEFPNKHERLGDFEKVESIINMYDLIQSFNGDELEAFRNAYLVFKNQVIDEEYMNKIAKTGGIQLGENGDVQWLIKQLSPEFIEKFLGRMKADIYRFSKTVDMSDEKFSGTGQTGESRKWKLKNLADDAIMKERSFEKAVLQMFNIIGEVSQLLSIDIIDRIDVVFTNNIPQDLKYHAEVTQILKGNVSEQTRLSLLPFIDDPDLEIEQMNQEREANMDFMEEQFNQNNPPDNNPDENNPPEE